jgi:hypothetical protein
MTEPAESTAGQGPGRFCPSSYAYAPETLARRPQLYSDTVYVAGGLYGNVFALQSLIELVATEPGAAVLVFNGDFNWLNVDPETFAAINNAVAEHIALRGNVETELAHEDEATGCGCAYPSSVDDAEVGRSNEIISRLRETARAFPAIRMRLRALPMHLTADVAGVHVAIVHGDAESLAGWAYSEQSLRTAEGIERLRGHFIASGARVIASSHTCLPVALNIDTDGGMCALFNNGAAGMPNFRGTRYGVVTRISTRPARKALYGRRIGAAYVDAIAAHYDHARWIESFLENWPAGSPAHVSYFRRMTEGPAYELRGALRGRVTPGGV